MKKVLFAFSIVLLTFSACNKDDEYQNTGVITGPDYSMRPCGGGWFVDIDNTTYRFYEVPESSELNLDTETFPISIKLNWKKADILCAGDEIVVDDIIKD